MPADNRDINAEIGQCELDTSDTRRKSGRVGIRAHVKTVAMLCVIATGCATTETARENHSSLLEPNARQMNRRAPDIFKVRLETSKGDIVIEVRRDWAPHGADRFYNLVRAGYYDEARFFRVIQGRWAQFGINGDPHIANIWRTRFISDDPKDESNLQKTVAFAE